MYQIQFPQCAEHSIEEMAGDLDLPPDYIVRYIIVCFLHDTSGWMIPSEISCAKKWRESAERKYPQLLLRFAGDAWLNKPLSQSRFPF